MDDRRDRKRLAVTSLLLGIGVVILLALRSPLDLGIPVCPLHGLTGLHCPGCGSLRAMHLLLQGDFLGALRHNVLLILLLPAAAVLWVREWRASFSTPRPSPLRPRPMAAWGIVFLIALFAVARNLPGSPFSLLAPP